MFENKRILNPKAYFKLEFDIKTDDENILKVIEKIQELIGDEFNNSNLVVEVTICLTDLNNREVDE